MAPVSSGSPAYEIEKNIQSQFEITVSCLNLDISYLFSFLIKHTIPKGFTHMHIPFWLPWFSSSKAMYSEIQRLYGKCSPNIQVHDLSSIKALQRRLKLHKLLDKQPINPRPAPPHYRNFNQFQIIMYLHDPSDHLFHLKLVHREVVAQTSLENPLQLPLRDVLSTPQAVGYLHLGAYCQCLQGT